MRARWQSKCEPTFFSFSSIASRSVPQEPNPHRHPATLLTHDSFLFFTLTPKNKSFNLADASLLLHVNLTILTFMMITSSVASSLQHQGYAAHRHAVLMSKRVMMMNGSNFCWLSSSPVIPMDDDEPVVSSDSHHTSTIRSSNTKRTPIKSTASPSPRPIFVAATRQHVGKTSVSLALLSGLQERFAPSSVAFMKPVGQQYVPLEQPPPQPPDTGSDHPPPTTTTTTYLVDKDVALVRQHFHMSHCHVRDMSPVLIPAGYTKDYLNGRIHDQDQRHAIQTAYANLVAQSSVVLCEGTGHVAVGSIVGASNAQVASWLGADMVLVANGGIGQCFDDLELNRQLCLAHHVRIAGVIVNKVQPAKYEQTKHFLTKALQHHWRDTDTDTTSGDHHVPLLGCIPDRPYLGCPALKDLERLLDAQPLHPITIHQEVCAVDGLRLRHYRELFLVATSLEVFLKNVRSLPSRTLYVCHASRHDILLGFMGEYQRRHQEQQQQHQGASSCSSSDENNSPNGTSRMSNSEEEEDDHHDHPHHHHYYRYAEDEVEDWQAALVVCGVDDTHPLSPQLQDILASPSPRHEHLPPPPILVTPHSMDQVMQMFYSYTPKLNVEDSNRVQTAVDHYKPYIDFDLLLERTGYTQAAAATVNNGGGDLVI
jgi:dethiobiotin synthetase